MGYLSCNAESAICTCDSYPLKRKPRKPFKLREFSYSDLHSATHGFSQANFLGKGSHGSVYKAILDGGKLIAAVKKTTSPDLAITNVPAENEIEILSRVRNPRLVNLLGFAVANSRERKLIVVEFMPNGSLYDLLHNNIRPPGWARRLRFALQIAKAVHYLHSSSPPVIHRDIKSSNVLIDADYNARLGDFGLALRGHVEDVRAKCTPPAGTLGYLDPGYLAPGDLSSKSDVFSFGIMFLEIVGGRKAIDVNYSPPSVVEWALPIIKSGEYSGICDPRIGPPEDLAAMRQLAVLAARCVRSTADKRPAMAEVVERLKAVYKRVNSPIWNNNFGRCVGGSARGIKYEPLDYSTEMIRPSRAGSRRNKKVSNVNSSELALDLGPCSDRVVRSKSISSLEEINFGSSDSNINQAGQQGRRRAGLSVKMPNVRLRKSMSMGMLQGARLANDCGGVLQIVRSPNGRELEESKLLVNVEKMPNKDE